MRAYLCCAGHYCLLIAIGKETNKIPPVPSLSCTGGRTGAVQADTSKLTWSSFLRDGKCCSSLYRSSDPRPHFPIVAVELSTGCTFSTEEALLTVVVPIQNHPTTPATALLESHRF